MISSLFPWNNKPCTLVLSNKNSKFVYLLYNHFTSYSRLLSFLFHKFHTKMHFFSRLSMKYKVKKFKITFLSDGKRFICIVKRVKGTKGGRDHMGWWRQSGFAWRSACASSLGCSPTCFCFSSYLSLLYLWLDPKCIHSYQITHYTLV